MSVASPFSVYNISYLVAEFKERIKFRPLILGCRGFPAGVLQVMDLRSIQAPYFLNLSWTMAFFCSNIHLNVTLSTEECMIRDHHIPAQKANKIFLRYI